MRDPYEVLEIQRGASKDEIKTAYRKLAKQYHPDMHVNNPLKDLAQEKFIEVQEAYDQLMNEGGSSSSYSSSQSSYNSGASNNEFQTARQYMNSGNYQQAIYILDNIKVRNAQWNFLMGVCYVNLGSTVQGMQFVKNASIDCCTQLICADCCCECMGGDLISCC